MDPWTIQTRTRFSNRILGSDIFDGIPSGDVNTFYDHVMNAGHSLHGGNPLSFFIENQKEYIETVADRGRWRRDESHAHHDMDAMPMDGLVPTNHIDAMGMCPHEVGGDAWDYDAHEDVTITDRSVILTDSITVNHLVIGSGGRLIFGEPSNDEIMLRIAFKSFKYFIYTNLATVFKIPTYPDNANVEK